MYTTTHKAVVKVRMEARMVSMNMLKKIIFHVFCRFYARNPA